MRYTFGGLLGTKCVERCSIRRSTVALGALSYDNLSFRFGRKVLNLHNEPVYGDIVEVSFTDPSNPKETYGVFYFGDKKYVVEEAVWDGEGLSNAIRQTRVTGCDKVAVWQRIYIARAERGGGAGKKVVDNVLSALAAAGVRHVFLQAHESASFWKKMGFVDTGFVLESYDSEDPVMYRKLGE